MVNSQGSMLHVPPAKGTINMQVPQMRLAIHKWMSHITKRELIKIKHYEGVWEYGNSQVDNK